MTLDNAVAQIIVSIGFLAFAVGTWSKAIMAVSKFLDDQQKRASAPSDASVAPTKSAHLGYFLVGNLIVSFAFMSLVFWWFGSSTDQLTLGSVIRAGLLVMMVGCHLVIVTILCFIFRLARLNIDMTMMVARMVNLLMHRDCTADRCALEDAKCLPESKPETPTKG